MHNTNGFFSNLILSFSENTREKIGNFRILPENVSVKVDDIFFLIL